MFLRYFATVGLLGVCAAVFASPRPTVAAEPTAKRSPRSESAKAKRAEPVGKPYVYKTVGQRALRLYVVSPPDAKPSDSRPAIVFFHGGGWVGGAPTQFDHLAEHLASRGMVAVQVEYRLLDRKGNAPPICCIQDAKSAMRWVRAHAGELGIDPNRIAAGGGSAGGHLAAFVGMVEGMDDPGDDPAVSPKANAMVLFNPVFDNGPKGWGNQRVGDRYRAFSPAHNVTPDDPPAIVFLGTEDKLIPVETAKEFGRAMKQAGVRCEVLLYEGQGHGFFNYGRSGGEYYRKTLEAADKFLTSLGWLPRQDSSEKQ